MNQKELQDLHKSIMELYIKKATGKEIDTLISEVHGSVVVNGTNWVMTPECVLEASRIATYSLLEALYKENNLSVPEFITSEINDYLSEVSDE